MPRAVVGYGEWAVVVQTPRRSRRNTGFFEELTPHRWPTISPRSSPRCSPREPIGFVEVGHSPPPGHAPTDLAGVHEAAWDSEEEESPEPPREDSGCTRSKASLGQPLFEGLDAHWPPVEAEPWTPPRYREEPWASALEVEIFDVSDLPAEVQPSHACMRV